MASMGGGGKMTRPPGDRDRRSHPYRKEPRQPPPADERIENKLYVGNLDHKVTEYHVLKMFTPFGKIKREEFLYHTYGPKRGEPRGYAFVEYATREEAERARAGMNGKPAFGRPLVVRFVDEKVVTYNQDAPMWRKDAPSTPGAGAGAPGAGGAGGPGAAAAKGEVPGAAQKSISKSAKIAAIQRKLRTMEQEDKLRVTAKKPPLSLLPSSTPEPPPGWAGGPPMDGRDAGRGPQDPRPPQSKTLLTAGHRWMGTWG